MSENENNEEVIQTEEDINRLMQVRIDKLKELQDAGIHLKLQNLIEQILQEK